MPPLQRTLRCTNIQVERSHSGNFDVATVLASACMSSSTMSHGYVLQHRTGLFVGPCELLRNSAMVLLRLFTSTASVFLPRSRPCCLDRRLPVVRAASSLMEITLVGSTLSLLRAVAIKVTCGDRGKLRSRARALRATHLLSSCSCITTGLDGVNLNG